MLETTTEINPEAAEASLREALKPTVVEAAPSGKSDTAPQQTAETVKVEGETKPDSTLNDTRATADKDKPAPTDKIETVTDNKSGYAKNQDRLEKTWKSVNERKTQLDAQEAQLKQQASELESRASKLQLDSVKAKSKFSPEQYEEAATNRIASSEQLLLQADGLDKRAEKLEADGKYGESELAKKQAQDLREQAAGEKYSAKQLKEMAEKLRKNPEPTLKQHQDTLEQHRQHYTVEAAKVWPDLAVAGSEFQKAVLGHLNDAAKSGLDPKENPVLIYHVARLVAAETAAARVPVMEKELGVMQARVKELEALTAPEGGKPATQRSTAAPADFSKMTLEQMESQLRADSRR